ncbi:hypothetical protein [Pseudooceanicola nanhaiensis]|uniref:hypothetical protein n=1 Tax=Pseudooceanicola nanhaiensis TaxID=375761 RepID=UPI003519A408
MASCTTVDTNTFIEAIIALRQVARTPNPEVVSRKTNGEVEIRYTCSNGNYLSATFLVPPPFASLQKLRLLDVHAWHESAGVLLDPLSDEHPDQKRVFLLFKILDHLRPSVMEALGPSARRAIWFLPEVHNAPKTA